MPGYFTAGGLIVDRLRDRVAAVPAINTRPVASLEWAINNPLDPGISVVFFDDVVVTGSGGEARRGKCQTTQQIWLVLVSARNVADAGPSALTDVGEILTAVLEALQGFTIPKQLNELYRVKCPFRRTDKDGFVHFPLLFATQVIMVGTG